MLRKQWLWSVSWSGGPAKRETFENGRYCIVYIRLLSFLSRTILTQAECGYCGRWCVYNPAISYIAAPPWYNFVWEMWPWLSKTTWNHGLLHGWRLLDDVPASPQMGIRGAGRSDVPKQSSQNRCLKFRYQVGYKNWFECPVALWMKNTMLKHICSYMES
jgi:hypothetical protein